MNFFVILPDQLFSRDKDISFILEYDEIYLVEDPVLFSLRNDDMKEVMHSAFKAYYNMLKSATNNKKREIKFINRLKVMERGGSYVSKKEGGGGEKEFNCCNAAAFHSHKEAPSFLEYFVGVNKQMNMWRPSNHWLWGDRIREMTFNGLPINFHESPQFMLSFDEVRKYFHRGESYSERLIIKNLCDRFDLKYELPGNGEEYPIIYKLESSYHPIDVNSSMAIINKFMSKYVFGNLQSNSASYTCPQIDYILGMGIITPFEIIDMLKKNALYNPEFVYYLLRREYFRIIYLANSDLMCREKLRVTNGACEAGNVEGGLYTDKQTAEYMLKCAESGVGSWKSCVNIIKKSCNLFPWSLLPRSVGAAIDLNAIHGKMKHFRSCMPVSDKIKLISM